MEDEQNRDLFGFMLKGNHLDAQDDSSQPDGEFEDPFYHFMFGKPRADEPQASRQKIGPAGILDQVDLEEVLYHVDTLITSARELKPLFGKVKPYLANLINK